ncbi:MAG: glycosyltransferase family 4 protein [Candidatus Hodarchaeota archaeon]
MKFRTKILFLSHSSIWGGAQSCLYFLIKGISAQKYKPLVVLPDDGPLNEKIKELGIRTKLMELEWCGKTQTDGYQYAIFGRGLKERVNALVELIREEQIDLVFTNTAVILDGAFAARLCGVPHIWHILELLSLDPVIFPFLNLEAFYTLINTITDKMIVVSKSVEAEIRQYIQTEKIEVIYTGIEVSNGRYRRDDKEKIFGFDNDTPTVSFVGMLSERKGVLNLVDTASLVLSRFPETKFVIVGPDAGVLNIMQRRIKEKQIDYAFQFLGFRTDVLNIIANSDIFVLPSLADPLPVVVLEAMATGIPVIATQSGGAAEMVVNEKTGLVVRVNDPADMAHAIISLLENPKKMKVMGKRGRNRVKKVFSYEQYIRNFERLFYEVASMQRNDDPLTKELTSTIVTLVEAAASDKVKIIEQHQKLEELETFYEKVRNYPFYKVYRWLNHLRRRLG